MTFRVPVLSLIVKRVRIGSWVRSATLPTMIIFKRLVTGSTYVCDILSLDFKNIIWSWCSFINHLHCDRRENTVLALPAAHLNLILLCMHAFSSS